MRLPFVYINTCFFRTFGIVGLKQQKVIVSKTAPRDENKSEQTRVAFDC